MDLGEPMDPNDLQLEAWYYADGKALAAIERQLVFIGDRQVVLRDKRGNLSVTDTDGFLVWATPMPQ